MRKVKITQLPKAAGGGNFGVHTPPNFGIRFPHKGNDPEVKIKKILSPTDKANATLEAERNETVVTDLNMDGMPEFYTVGGKPHSRGGTPLNLPGESFFFSQNKNMKITDPEVLKLFGKTGKAAKKGYTPAELSKQYNLNNYHEILADPTSNKMERKTAEMMIQILDEIDAVIESDKPVYVHCLGGIGRTGTVVGCYLLRHGLATGANVLEKIQELRLYDPNLYRDSPETSIQRNFVLNWREQKPEK